jgi:hypothetical protein
VYSTLNQWTTEELFFPIHDFEGTIEENRDAYERWDPARFIDQWATPQLVSTYLDTLLSTPESWCLGD